MTEEAPLDEDDNKGEVDNCYYHTRHRDLLVRRHNEAVVVVTDTHTLAVAVEEGRDAETVYRTDRNVPIEDGVVDSIHLLLGRWEAHDDTMLLLANTVVVVVIRDPSTLFLHHRQHCYHTRAVEVGGRRKSMLLPVMSLVSTVVDTAVVLLLLDTRRHRRGYRNCLVPLMPVYVHVNRQDDTKKECALRSLPLPRRIGCALFRIYSDATLENCWCCCYCCTHHRHHYPVGLDVKVKAWYRVRV